MLRYTNEPKDVAMSLRVSQSTRLLWEATAEKLGQNMTAIAELAIRKLAFAEGFDLDSIREEKETGS